VAEQLTRGCTSAFALSESLLTLDDDRTVTFSTLHAAPLVTGEVMGDLSYPVGFDVKIVDDDVCRKPFAHHPAITKPRGMSGQRLQTIVRLLERDLLLVPHQPLQEVGREGAAGEELGVRPAVGYAGEGIR
jgi:hypothetical protein